jgi:hypothetical protein
LNEENVMSIDARVDAIILYVESDMSGELHLIDRPGNPPGIAGQRKLYFDKAPHEVTALNGLDIWGGGSGIMLGDVEIAKRVGYATIVFYGRETFLNAVKFYHEKRREAQTAQFDQSPLLALDRTVALRQVPFEPLPSSLVEDSAQQAIPV